MKAHKFSLTWTTKMKCLFNSALSQCPYKHGTAARVQAEPYCLLAHQFPATLLAYEWKTVFLKVFSQVMFVVTLCIPTPPCHLELLVTPKGV